MLQISPLIEPTKLVLPRYAVEEHIILNMDEAMRNRLLYGDRRANVWVVDDEMCRQYLLTIVDREHRYSVISWSHVLQDRMLNEGQQIKFGWIFGRLHFVVGENVKKTGEGKDAGNHKSHGDKRPKGPPKGAKKNSIRKMKQVSGGRASNNNYCK